MSLKSQKMADVKSISCLRDGLAKTLPVFFSEARKFGYLVLAGISLGASSNIAKALWKT
jgi:hypothetical protein